MANWEVVGGADKGGILVREASDLKSSQNPMRLSTGALIRELQMVGDRLQYELLEGDGPKTGWVSVSLKDKALVVKTDRTLEQDRRTIFDFNAELADGSVESLATYRSSVTLIVNTASKCGFTKQYAGLQKLHEDYSSKGLIVLAFPCNQFHQQEDGTNSEIQNFVKEKYGVTFPVFGKANVNGDDGVDVFQFLKKSVDDKVPKAAWAKDLFPEEKDIQWNFTKFLCVDGRPVKRFSFSIEPSKIAADIETALANAARRPSAFQSWRPPCGRKPRVVCLHGAGCGDDIFRMQLAKLVPSLKDRFELVFVEGPLEVTEVPLLQKYFPGKRNRQYEQVIIDSKGWRYYANAEKTLEWLQAQLKIHEPVDGILAFSQGANFATMLAAQSSMGTGLSLGFVVLLSPSAPGYVEKLPKLFGQSISVPALIVGSDKETYSTGFEEYFEAQMKEGSIVLDTKGESAPSAHVAKLFSDRVYISHKEDHRPLPADREDCAKIVDAIRSFMEVRCKFE